MNSTTSLPAKPHYPVLDGLRGVASVMVVLMHLFEAHATSHLDMTINHGYLAVDFFFLLSGFVIGYAYDDRWSKMTTGNFFLWRLVRLQPMVIIGMLIGAIAFYFQASALWPAIANTPVWKVLLVMLVGFTMLPLPPSMDIRGWAEMHPLNGPAWSLFFEYVVNILYATIVRRFSRTALTILVLLSAGALLHLALTSPAGDLIGGWSLDPTQLHIGLARVFYPFFAGLLLFRIGRLKHISNAFFWCSLLVIIIFAMPRIGGSEHLWLNGLYEALCVIFIFPLVIYIGASGELKGRFASRFCRFLGDMSYPVYITHYPLVYLYTAWIHDNAPSKGPSVFWGVTTFLTAFIIAYAYLKLYDEPVRRWLGKRLLSKEIVGGQKESPIPRAT